MSEYAIQIPDSLLATVQRAAAKNHISVNQFLLTAARNSLITSQTEQTLEGQADLSERWENYFAIARNAPDEFMEDANSSYEQAMTEAFAEMDQGLPLGGQPLIRESLYER
jgi:hypothetical protein